MNKLIKKIVTAVGMGSFVFVVWIVISCLIGGKEEFFAETSPDMFLANIAYFIIIALGYYVSSLIYENETMNIKFEVLIHMLIGGTIFLIVATVAGWLPIGLNGILIYLVIALITTGVFWIILTKLAQRDAKIMNSNNKLES